MVQRKRQKKSGATLSHDKVFSIRISADLFERLDVAVKRDGRKRNAVIVDALSRHLEFLRVVAEQSAELVATLSGEELKEVATNELLRGASEAARDVAAGSKPAGRLLTPEAGNQSSGSPSSADAFWADEEPKP